MKSNYTKKVACFGSDPVPGFLSEAAKLKPSVEKVMDTLKSHLNFLLILIIGFFTALMPVTDVNAQPVQIGTATTVTGGTNQYGVFNIYYRSERRQHLYLASELTAAAAPANGLITNIQFYCDAPTTYPLINWEIKIAQTTQADLSIAYPGTFTSVYTTTNFTPVVGWNSFNLTTPIIWDGTSNILLDICNDITNPTFSSVGGTNRYTATSFTSVRYVYSDGSNQCPVAMTVTTTSRANAIFNFIPPVPCTGTPVPGNTTLNVSPPVCPSQNFTLGFQNMVSVGVGINMQWQYASSSTGPWNNIPGANGYNYTTNQTATTWYRCLVTCLSTGLSDGSTPLEVTSAAGPMSGVFTINSAVSTGGSNYQSFNAAVNDLVCRGINGPITFNVDASSGPYTEQVTIPVIAGTSATNTITFNGNNRTLTYNATLLSNPHTLALNGADYVRVNDLNMVGTNATYALVGHLWNDADNNMFTNCTFTAPANGTSTSQIPFSISGSSTSGTVTGPSGINNIITGCTMNSGYYNTCLVGNSAAVSTGNQLVNCILKDFYFYGSYNLHQNGAIIRGNTIERPTRTTLSTFYGIYISSGCINVLVEKNRLRHPYATFPTSTGQAYAIYDLIAATAGNENKFYNNVISDFICNGVIAGLYLSGGNHLKAYHNTISFNHTASTFTGATYGIYATGTAGVDIRNNNVSITRGGTGTKYGMYFTGATGKISNNNNIHVAASAGINVIGFYISNYLTLASWKTANAGAWDQQSLSVDPMFASPTDFTPANSSINNIGAGLGVTTDINGAVRSLVSPDPGAYEFSAVGLDASITWVSPTSPSSSGLKTIIVNISNTQTVDINSITITYTDGITPVTQNFTGLNILSNTNQNLSFTTQYNLISSTTITTTINNVNGIADNIPGNNVVAYPLCIGLNGNYTINNGAPASATNFTSFNSAVSSLNCGITGPVVFDVAPGSGPYTEQVDILPVNGSSAINTVTFNGNSRTLTFNATSSSFPHTLMLSGADHFIFNNLNIVGTGTSFALAAHLWNQADNNTFSNCTFTVPANGTSTGQVPFSISGSNVSATTSGISGNYNLVTGCTMNSGYYSTCIVGDFAVSSLGNQVVNCNIRDFYFYGSYNLYQNGAVIRGNTIERPTRSSVSTFYGVYVSTGCTNLLVEKNKIRSPFGDNPAFLGTAYGIYCPVDGLPGAENRFFNNLIYNMQGTSTVAGLYMTGADYYKAYHNTISLDFTGATGSATTYGIYSTGTTGGVDIKNNVITISRSSTGTRYGIYFSSNLNISCNNNDIYVNGTLGTNLTGYYLSGFATLANWQTANGGSWDQNSVSIDPDYSDPVNGDFAPFELALNNIGANVGITTDIDGNARVVATPDPGAYELQLHPINMGATALVSPFAGSCMTSSQQITLTIKNYGINALNFGLTPATVTCNITGTTTATLTTTVSSGSLAVGASMNVTLSGTVDLSINGSYTFNAYTTVAGDGQLANDDMNPVTLTRSFAVGVLSASTTDQCISSPNPTLTLTGATGGNIQWQSSTASASGPWTNVGGGLSTYSPAIVQGTYYQITYTCDLQTATSNSIHINVEDPQLGSTTGAVRCGAGSVTLNATAAAGLNIEWFDSMTGGNLLYTGPAFTTPMILSSANFYAQANTGTGTGASKILITELTGDDSPTDFIEFTNVYNSAVDISGWKVTLSNASLTVNDGVYTYPNGTIIPPGGTFGFADATTINFPTWVTGNIIWTNGQEIYAMIFDNNNVLQDMIVGVATATTISTTTVTVPGVGVFPLNSGWSGNGIPMAAGAVIKRTGNYDNGNASDWTSTGSTSFTTVNPAMSIPFIGYGCASLRTLVPATVTPAPLIAASSGSTFLCSGNPTTLSVTSSNANYGYSWTSLPAGFTATGAGPINIFPTAASTTYKVYALDPSTQCGAFDEVVIATTTNQVTINPNTLPTSICPGYDMQLNANATEGAYCLPTYNTACSSNDFIYNVTVGLINNTTGCTGSLPNNFNYYSLYSTPLAVGTNYPMTVTVGASFAQGVSVWIDFNQNLTYEASELVYSNFVGTNGFTYAFNISVPASAYNGQTRMRVRCAYNSLVSGPCTLHSFGDCEDYPVVISGGQPVATGFTYLWTGPNLNANNIPSPTAQALNSTTSYNLEVTSNLSGCKKYGTINAVVNPQPTAFSPVSNAVCEGNGMFLNQFGVGATSYSWSGPSGYISSGIFPGAPTLVTSNGTIGIHDGQYRLVVSNAFGCKDTSYTQFDVNPNPLPVLTALDSVTCPGFNDGLFTVGVNAGTSPFFFEYNSGLGNFDLSSNGTFPEDPINLGSYYIMEDYYDVLVSDANGCTGTLNVVVGTEENEAPQWTSTPTNIVLSNNPGMCNATASWPVPTWTDDCPGTTMAQTAGFGNSAAFPIGTTTVTYVVTDAGDANSAPLSISHSFNVTVNDNELPSFTNCPVNNLDYCNPVTWTPPTFTDNCAGMVVVPSHSPGVILPVGPTTVTYTATDAAGNIATCSFVVNRLAESVPSDTITSNREFHNICIGEDITMTVGGGSLGAGASWKWYTNAAGTGSPVFTGSVYTTQPTTTTTYYVRAEGTCNMTPMTAITVVVSTSGPGTVTITSVPAVGAVGQSGVLTVAAVPGAQYYQYTSNLGHISAILFDGQVGPYLSTSNSVNVTFQLPLQNYQIRVIALNACGRSNTASAHIRGTVAQGTSIISSTGNLVACPNQAVTYTGAAVSGSNLYTWTIIPASAGTITSGQGGLVVNVTWAAGFSGSAQLCYHGQTNFNLAGPDYCVTISTNAPTPGAITGNNQPCQGGNGGYSIIPVIGATNYNWTTTIPGASVIGTGISGSATFPGGTFSGDICVTANTSCGVSAASCMPITSGAAGIPDPIAGPSTGVCNLSGINYTVNAPGATGFAWSSADPNIFIASGGSSNSVLVNFLPGFTSGSLDVDVTYACGTTPASIAINGAPAMPVVAPAIICDGTGIQYFASSQSATQFNWTATGALIESCGNPTLCSQYFIEWDFGGTLSVTAQNTCGVSPAFSAFGSCRLAQLDANVYPNPTSGQATVEFEAAGQTTYSIKVTDLAGRIIINQEVTSVRGLNQVNIDLTDAGKGLYLVHLNGQDGTALVKRLAVE